METEIVEEKKVIRGIDLKLKDTMYQVSSVDGKIMNIKVNSLAINSNNIDMTINGWGLKCDAEFIGGVNVYFTKEKADNHYLVVQENKVKNLAEDLVKREKQLELEINKLDELKAKSLLR